MDCDVQLVANSYYSPPSFDALDCRSAVVVVVVDATEACSLVMTISTRTIVVVVVVEAS